MLQLQRDQPQGAVTVANATTYRITRGASYDQFTGNLIYTDGVLTGGTITGWTRVSAGGSEFTVTGLALPVITLLGALDAADDDGFLEAVFHAADTMTGTALQRCARRIRRRRQHGWRRRQRSHVRP